MQSIQMLSIIKSKTAALVTIISGVILLSIAFYSTTNYSIPYSRGIQNESIENYFVNDSLVETTTTKNMAFNPKAVKINSTFLYIDTTKNAENVCALPVYDYWYLEMKQERKRENPMRNCDKNYKRWTELENSTWRIVKKGASCKARCIEGVGYSSEVVLGDWIGPGRVDCEFLEAVCEEKGGEDYGFIHTQMIEKPHPPISNPSSVYNVFIITIDSMDTGMAKRSLPNFLTYLQSELEAVEFLYVNKLGDNSKPNGIPLWFGKSIEPGPKTSNEELPVDWTKEDYCLNYLDKHTHIFKTFKDKGYVTILMEDWMSTLVEANPTCKGFEKSPVDHDFHPFTSAMERYSSSSTRYHLNGRTCREIHHAMFDYLEQGIQIHKDHQPIFSHMWSARMSHDWIDGIERADLFLVDFFKRHQDVFDHSFVFLLSDHGLRLGKHLSTEQGRLEKNNPYLSISVPKELRGEEYGILETMKENSRKLQTHFDTRATLLDIAEFQPKANYKDRQQIDMPNEKGQSLLRRQPDYPRTCATLPIPRQYCICQVERREILDEQLKTYLGERMLEHIRNFLIKEGFENLCEDYKLDEVKLEEYGYTEKVYTYDIMVKTKYPNFAHIQTTMSYDPVTNATIFDRMTRLDSYGRTANCTNDIKHEPVCYCK
ncbi:unnamed protein product [Caenorhabditis brenneri]